MAIGPLHGRTVYALVSSRDGVAMYVGSTSRPVAARLRNHYAAMRSRLKWCRSAALPVHAWMAAEHVAGYEITAVTLIENACVWCERAEILRRLAAGEPLLNVVVKGTPKRYEAYLSLDVPLECWGSSMVRNGIRRFAAARAARVAAEPVELLRAS